MTYHATILIPKIHCVWVSGLQSRCPVPIHHRANLGMVGRPLVRDRQFCQMPVIANPRVNVFTEFQSESVVIVEPVDGGVPNFSLNLSNSSVRKRGRAMEVVFDFTLDLEHHIHASVQH